MANTSKYLERADAPADAIRRGCAPGDRFPTVVEPAEAHGVAPDTVGRAVQVLEERGLPTGKAGGITRVRVRPTHHVRRNTRHRAEKDLVRGPEEVRLPAVVRAELRCVTSSKRWS